MPIKQLVLSSIVLAVMTALLMGRSPEEPASGPGMVKAAQNFLKTLNQEQRAKATFAYNDPERLNWHFIPRPRKGLPLKDLEGDALRAAQRLLASGVSEAGYEQSLNVMSLEEILYLLEGGDRQTRRDKRDPLKYYVSIFGTPASAGTWGWRVEGHHLSLNYSIADGKVVATTPEFFGANPGTVDAGKGRRIRVLGPEEDLARQILKLCSPQQQKLAWIDKTAPRDLRGGGVAQPDTTPPVGLPAAKMSPAQKKLLADLLSEYLKNMPRDVEQKRRAQIESAGRDAIHFAWWGDAEQDRPHYYRVQGKTFLIEYNNTQNNANHVHSIWRNLDGDFHVPIRKN